MTWSPRNGSGPFSFVVDVALSGDRAPSPRPSPPLPGVSRFTPGPRRGRQGHGECPRDCRTVLCVWSLARVSRLDGFILLYMAFSQSDRLRPLNADRPRLRAARASLGCFVFAACRGFGAVHSLQACWIANAQVKLDYDSSCGCARKACTAINDAPPVCMRCAAHLPLISLSNALGSP